jgi:predicted DsbA family dithiol-disulfide isomerase
VRSLIEEAGFTYAPPSFVPNSSRSLQLGELARARGRLDELHPRLFAAYWSDGRDIGDLDTLVSLGSSAGLDPGEVRRVIEEGTYRGASRPQRVWRSSSVRMGYRRGSSTAKP